MKGGTPHGVARGGIGAPVLRREDLRLLRGEGRYSDDVNLEGQCYAVMVRSPHAHAEIVRIDATAALAVPGVIAVLTGQDVSADGLKPIPHNIFPAAGTDLSSVNRAAAAGMDITLVNRNGGPGKKTLQPILAQSRARFVGENVAMVIAETAIAARDGAEAVAVDYRPLPALTATPDAVKDGAPIIWDDIPGNVCIDADVGDRANADAAFAKATHVVRLATWIPRVTGVTMEPRAAVGDYDPGEGKYTLLAGSGGVVRQKSELAVILSVPEAQVRVAAWDIGGNFGTRNSFFPEFALAVWAAKRVGRPVKWTATREEAFLSDYQGRDLYVEAELALDKQGNFLALRGSNLSNLGAYTASIVPLTKGVEIMTSVYRIPVAFFRARGVTTNTPSTAPYRSAGRPEVIYVMERLVDLACKQHGFDPLEIRRRNFVPASAMPYPNGLGMTYDSGDYPAALEDVLQLADLAGFAARNAESAKRGRLRGLGIASYMETSTGAPRERSEVTVRPEGKVDLLIGTLSAGQGHETSFPQLITEFLGVPIEDVRFIQGDTDIVPAGGGSHSGRSMRLAGIVVGKCSDEIIEKGKRIAGAILEAATDDIVFSDRSFRVAGTDRSIGLFDVAKAAAERTDLPADLRGALKAESDIVRKIPAFPYGAHICEVEVDPETGAASVVRYAAVDDVGRAVNPLILHGQAHGGITQGLGQALCELCHYDKNSGQMLSASFMDYALLRASDLPSFICEISEHPSPNNPLGIRAGGEGGTTPALGVLVNAIVDALKPYGVSHIELPVTPEKVWRAIHAGSASSARRKTHPRNLPDHMDKKKHEPLYNT
jgi:aerobic carbon-monoxide dehydrogenase large subunit